MQVNPKFITFAKELLPVNPVICDIGSRDALEGIHLFHELGGKCLHVFEPNPAAAAICRMNLERVPGDVHFNELAVSDGSGKLPFYPVNPDLSDNKDIGFSSLFPVNPDYMRRRGHISQDEVIVTATTLDEYFTDKQQPDLLWIDVEGAELKVFSGATNVLRNVAVIYVEVSFRPMQIGKPLFGDIHQFLKKNDFVFYGFMEVSALRGFLYRYHLWPSPPWRLNAIFYKHSGLEKAG